MRRGKGIQRVFGSGCFGDVVGGALLAAACGSSAMAGDVCGNPSAGSCFMIQRTPGCSDAECCGAVCSVDPYCCSTEWDSVCRQQANDAPACGAPVPSNDAPSAPTFMTVGLQPYSTVGATDSSATTIPPSCGGVFGDTILRDVWFEYRASVTGTARLSTCPQSGSGAYSEFDPIIVMRDPVTLESLACNDEGSGCAGYAVLEFAVTAGERYLIQIGGHDAEIGYGAMRVTESGKPAETPENDSCASASTVALPTAGESVPFDILGANVDDASCGSEPHEASLTAARRRSNGTLSPAVGSATVEAPAQLSFSGASAGLPDSVTRIAPYPISASWPPIWMR